MTAIDPGWIMPGTVALVWLIWGIAAMMQR
jgi:hypothetical protein